MMSTATIAFRASYKFIFTLHNIILQDTCQNTSVWWAVWTVAASITRKLVAQR